MARVHTHAQLPSLPCPASFDSLQVLRGNPSLNDHWHVCFSSGSDTDQALLISELFPFSVQLEIQSKKCQFFFFIRENSDYEQG